MAGDVTAVRTSAEVRDLLAAALGVDVGLDELADPHTLDVPAASWVAALQVLRDDGLDYLDWLSAVDLGGDDGFQVVAHLARVGSPGRVEHWLVRTALPAADPVLETATSVFRGAAWHERETHEMFGIDFTGHPHLVPLLLPDGFVGHPLRKDFVLAARVAKPWPGAKEPGESGDGPPSRRRVQPPGLPDESWGPRAPEPPAAEASGTPPEGATP